MTASNDRLICFTKRSRVLGEEHDEEAPYMQCDCGAQSMCRKDTVVFVGRRSVVVATYFMI